MDGFLPGYSAGFIIGVAVGMGAEEFCGINLFGDREIRNRRISIGVKAEVKSEGERQSLDKELRALSEKYQLRVCVEESGKRIEYKINEILG